MTTLLAMIAALAAVLACCGLLAVATGAILAWRFATAPLRLARDQAPVTVLKPLCGDEPMLEVALASICDQSYPTYQIVFGVRDASDPALGTVERIRRRFPDRDITIVANPALHGPNRKISNLINMMHAARHDVLVFSDSDLHVPPDYLQRIAAALDVPGTGLVTTISAGLPTNDGMVARLGAMGISHSFMPGALMSRMLGRQDCLGTTMAITRDTLARIGGLSTLSRHLADDNVLGQKVRRLGLDVRLARTVTMTAVPEATMRALWQHELRWGRTIRLLEPMLFAASVVQFPLFWAALALAAGGGSAWSEGLLAITWITRAVAAWTIDAAVRRRAGTAGPAASVWLLPFRDLLSVSRVAASYLGVRVVWRGQVMRADSGRSSWPEIRGREVRKLGSVRHIPS